MVNTADPFMSVCKVGMYTVSPSEFEKHTDLINYIIIWHHLDVEVPLNSSHISGSSVV